MCFKEVCEEENLPSSLQALGSALDRPEFYAQLC